jgi:ADP-ribosylglycohydrolase
MSETVMNRTTRQQLDAEGNARGHRSGISRRAFAARCAVGAVLSSSVAPWRTFAQEPPQDQPQLAGSKSRIQGLLWGGLLGDALGGPVEFSEPTAVAHVLPNTRAWDENRKIDAEELKRLGSSLELHGYGTLRPDPAPYGPWQRKAAAGTVTDDSRHKMVLMRTLQAAMRDESLPISARDVARQYLVFEPRPGNSMPAELMELNDEGFREYRLAARWLLGERDLRQALPVERLWAGIANCSGQMMLPPLAAVYPGQPAEAYEAAWAIDFVDAPAARDMTAALIAGLAQVLGTQFDQQTPPERWTELLHTMRTIDPYRIGNVPFAGRPLNGWLDFAHDAAERAQGRPATLFQILEQEAKPVYWWDAHLTLVVPLAILHFTQLNPLAALHLTLDFGHDTDSYAQVLGCIVGAIYGNDVFPAEMLLQVGNRLAEDYGEQVDQWVATLDTLAQRHQAGRPVISTR